MSKILLAITIGAVIALAGCQQFRKTPTPTPDPTKLAMTPTSTLPSPVAITRVPNETSNPAAAGATPGVALSILSVSGAKPGEAASVSVQATPNASCTLAFIAPPGSATVGISVGPQTADATGHASWTWKIAPGTASGSGAVTVKCGDALASTSIRIG